MTTIPEPRNRIMKSIVQTDDDLGAFRAEYPGNGTYWLQMIVWGFCWCCMLLMAIVMPCKIHSIILLNARNAPPGEVPDHFYTIAWAAMVVLPVATLSFLIYIAHRIRKFPLVYGVFEKGFVVVCRDKTYRRVFWDSIRRIRVYKQGKKHPQLVGFRMDISMPEQWTEFRREHIPVDYFDEELCQVILDSVTKAEIVETPPITKQQAIRMVVIFTILVLALVAMNLFLGK
jgi:hypothetical protein